MQGAFKAELAPGKTCFSLESPSVGLPALTRLCKLRGGGSRCCWACAAPYPTLSTHTVWPIYLHGPYPLAALPIVRSCYDSFELGPILRHSFIDSFTVLAAQSQSGLLCCQTYAASQFPRCSPPMPPAVGVLPGLGPAHEFNF